MISTKPNLDALQAELAGVAREFGLSELSVFGSVLRNDFSEQSDVDVLIDRFGRAIDSADGYFALVDTLEQILGRTVHLTEKSLLRNPYKIKSIQSSLRVIYAA
jgi:uncharacterized protein